MPEWKDNPLTKIREVLVDAFKGQAALVAAVGGASNMQFFEKPQDIRGDMAKGGRSRFRLAMETTATQWNFQYGSHAVAFVRRYTLSIYADSTTDAAPAEWLEWQALKVLAMLNMKQMPGSASPPAFPAGVEVDDLHVAETDPERAMVAMEIEGWQNVCDLVVQGTVSFETLTADEEEDENGN